jgi:hypothetical protein
MDRNYIESEHIVDRYLAGELTVREARDFEKYCLEHPQFLNGLPIPVRLKARLARRPLEDSETGVFQAIPSSATHAALEATDEGFDPEEERSQWLAATRSGRGGSRILVMMLVFALIAAIGGIVAYGMHVNALEKQLKELKRSMESKQMQPAGSVKVYRLGLSRAKPAAPTLEVGWAVPPQLMDIYVDVTEGKYNTFQITVDKVDGGRVMQLRRVARDSNKELRFSLNSSAFGPGDYLLKFDGYTWRGQPEEIGWLRLGLQ